MESTFKGNIIGPTIEILYSRTPYNRLVPDEYGIFFLKQNSTQFIPTSDNDIVFEIRQGLENHSKVNQEPLKGIQKELLNTLSEDSIFSKKPDIVNRVNSAIWNPVTIKEQAVYQLGFFSPNAASLKVLSSLALKGDDKLRQWTIETLIKWKAKTVLQDILHPLIAKYNQQTATIKGDSNNPVVFSIARVFYGLGDATNMADLVPLLHSSNVTMRLIPLRTFPLMVDRRGYLPKSAIPYLIESLDDERPVIRLAAVGAFTETRDIEQTLMNPENAYIPELLQDKDAGVRLSLVQLLATMKDPAGTPSGKAIPYLVTALDDKDKNIRSMAMKGLSEITLINDWRKVDFENPDALVTFWKEWWNREGKLAFSDQ